MPHSLAAALLLLALGATQASAATRIDIKNPEGLASVYIDGARTRIDNGPQGYMIVDNASGSMQLVMPAQRQVIDMSFALNAPLPESGAPVKLVFTKTGAGPRIAGYPTSNYTFSADGQQCGSILASTEALQQTDLGNTLQTIEKMARRTDAMVSSFRSVAPCERAATNLSQHIGKVGMPMRVTSGAQLISEIVRIEAGAKLPANAFVVPADYQRQNPAEMMQGAQRLLQQLQSGQLPAQ
jgi:hypothetical protein